MPEVECSICHQLLPEDAFSTREGKRWGRQCKKCLAKVSQEWRDRNHEQYRAGRRRINLRSYGMTPEDFDRLMDAQAGRCAICRRPPKKGKHLSVDHNHTTGTVRGLLCARCNGVLGYLHEDIDLFAGCTTYLESPPADEVFTTPRRSPDAPPEEYLT